MRSLITGGSGFVGRHLATHLIEQGDRVSITHSPQNIPAAQASVEPFPLDIRDAESTKQLLAKLKPDCIYHLAAATFVPDAEANPEKAFLINVMGTLNLLSAMRIENPAARFLYVSTSEVYGPPPEAILPLSESAALHPNSIYGVSKAAADLAAAAAVTRYSTFAVRARPFPHTGPGQKEIFAISSFAKQVTEIRLRRKEPLISVGNLNVKRDYSDVRDIVRGYRQALLYGKPGEAYNFCSGQSYEIGVILQMLLDLAQVEAEIRPDPSRIRAFDIPEIRGTYEKAATALAWTPKIPLSTTLSDLLTYWLSRLT